MLFISAIKNGVYSVTDTLDGITENVSYNDLVDYTLKGVKIRGVNYRTNAELATTRKFGSVNVVSESIIQVKVGGIYKVTLKRTGESNTGIVTGITDNNGVCFTFVTGTEGVLKQEDFTTSVTRSISRETRDLLLNHYELVKNLNKAKSEIDRLNKLCYNLRLEIGNSLTNLVNSTGYLSDAQFFAVFRDNLDLRIKKFVENAYVANCHNGITIVNEVQLPFSLASKGYAYREYDGCLFISDTNCKEYKNDLKLYSPKLPELSNFEKTEWIGLGKNERGVILTQYMWKLNCELTRDNAVNLGRTTRIL